MRDSSLAFGDLAGFDRDTLIERVLDTEILPLEIWDLCVERTTLGKWSHDPGFPAALTTAIEVLRAGEGTTQSTGALPSRVAGFEAVFLAGGRLDSGDMFRELSAPSCPIFLSQDGAFAGGPGGFDLLCARGLRGWVIDLGQSQLKIMTPHGRWVFPRDRTRLRRAGDVREAEIPGQRRRLREFMALSVQHVMAEAGRPEALVAALPARIEANGTPRSSTYAGMRNDRTLLTDVLSLASIDGVPLLLLNDAELAACSARCDPRLRPFRKVLVLTLGYGIGAALIHRSS